MHLTLSFDGNWTSADGVADAKLGHAVGDDGIHGGWHFEGDQVQAWTDPLGFQPVFFCADASRCILSNSLLEAVVCGAPTDWNLRALGVFFRVGWFLGEDTPFEHIHVLPPGGRLQWRRGDTTLSRQDLTVEPDATLTRDAARDLFVDLFRESVSLVAADLDGPVLLPLSGGRDSRHILAELTRQGVGVEACVTYNYNPGGLDDEAQCAIAVAQRLGQCHRVIDGPRLGAGQRVRAMSVTHLCADEHQKMLVLRDDPSVPHCTLLDGIGGDVLSRNKGFANATIERCTATRDWIGMAVDLTEGFQRVVGHSVEDALSRRGLAARMPRDQALEDLADSLRQHAGFADPYRAFMFFTRTRREIALAPAAILSTARHVVCPYLHMPLVRMLLAMPLEVASRGGLHDEAIARAFPALADLPFADGEAIRWGRHSWRNHLSKIRYSLAIDSRLGLRHWVAGLAREARYLRERKSAPTEWLDSYLCALATGSSARGAARLMALADTRP